MERLTTTNKDASREMICRNEDCGVTEEHCPHLMEDECACLREVINKLADYEDAEEQGLLLRLPVCIGQTVYRINEVAENPIIPMGVTCIQHSGATKTFNKIFCVELGFGDLFEYRFNDIGITLFLTREEAESALAEKGTEDAKEK